MSLYSLLSFAPAVSAAGETFKQTDATHIVMSGAGTGTFTYSFTNGTSAQYDGTVTLAAHGNCQFSAFIFVQPGSTVGVMTASAAPPSAGNVGSTPPPACAATLYNSYNNMQFTIAGAQTAETAAQKIASVQVVSPLPAAKSPASITIVVKNSSGAVVSSSPSAKQADGTYQIINFTLNAGVYTFSVTGIAGISAQTVTKVKSVPLGVLLGDGNATQVIKVNVTGTYGINACQANTFGPIPLTATSTAGAQVTPAQTNTFNLPANPNCGDSGATGITTFHLSGTLNGVVAGTYKVCALSSCVNVTKKANQIAVADITLTPSDAASAGTGGGAAPTSASATKCDAGPGFTWIICGIITQIVGENGIVNAIRDNIIVPFLKVTPFTSKDASGVNGCTVAAGCASAAFQIWSAFRNVASVFFILVFFLIIIGTAVGFDNYTIKKVLPHLIAGAILIPFSWYLCAFVIDIGNVLGQGLVALISPIIGTLTIDLDKDWGGFFGISVPSVGTAVVGFALLQAGAASAGLGAAITILLAFLGVFLTLIMRQILITLMVVMSPFALLAWILPNTEKWFKTWWQNFFKLVMMYPIIMLLFEAGRLFAKTTGASNTTAAGWVTPLIQVTALMLPLFAVPFAFKFAGAGLAMAGGAVNKVTGAVDKKYGKDSSFANDLKEGRTRKNFEASKNASDDAANATGLRKIGLQRKAAFQMRRAGLSGIGGSAKLRRQAATPKLAGELDALDGEKRTSAELDRETFAQRRAAGTQSFVDDHAATRGTRQGILDGYEGGGRPRGSLKQSQARIKSRDSYAAGIGAAQGDVDDDRLNERERLRGSSSYVSPATKVAAARDTAALQSSEARGAAMGVVQGGIEAEGIIRDQTGLGAAAARDLRLRTVSLAKTNLQVAATVTAQQTASTNVSTNAELDQKQITDGNAITPLQARSLRLQNLSAATHGQERETLGLAEGQIDARNALANSAAGQENIGSLVTGGALAAREQLATARSLRATRADLQNTVKGHMSADDALEAGTIEASERLGASIGAQKQAIQQERSDTRRAIREGNPDLAPSLDNHVTAGIEAAKTRTAQASAQRMAAVNAVSNETAATTREHTDAAVHAAERATALANATTKGVAGTVNAGIAATAAALQVQAAASGQVDRAGANVALSDAEAIQAASKLVRARNLGATTEAGRAAAESKTATEISTDLGAGDTLNNEIATEVASIQDKARAAGAELPPAIARARAEENVRAQQISAASDVARNQSSVKTEADRKQVVGVQDSLKSQETEETDRIMNAPGNPLTEEQAKAQAKINVRNKNIDAAGAVIRQKSARDDRQTTDTTAGTADELDHEVKREMDLTGKTKAEAEDSVRARDLNTIGTNAKDASQRKAGQDRGTEIGTKLAIDAELDSVQKEAREAGAELPPELARARTQAKNISGASRASQIKAQKTRIQAPKDDQGTINAYEAAITKASEAPTTDKLEAVGNAAYDIAKESAGKRAYKKAYANQKKLQTKDKADGKTPKTEEEIKSIAEIARKEHGEAAGEKIGARAVKNFQADPSNVIAPLSREVSEINVINSLGVQAEEQTMRTEAAALGTTAAFNQAVKAKDALQANERLAAQTEVEVARIASESAAARARYNLTSPGKPLNRTYAATEEGARNIEEEKILEARTEEALRRPITYRTYKMEKDQNGNETNIPKLNPDGTPETITVNALKDAELSNEALAGMRDEVVELTKSDEPQTDRVIALMRRLAVSGPGQEELRYLKREVFGGDDYSTVDASKFKSQSKMIWDKGISTVPPNSAPDLRVPQIAIYDGVSPETFANMNWRAKRDYIDYVTNPDRGPEDDKARLKQEAAEAIIGTMNNKQLSGKLDEDAYKIMIGFWKKPIIASESSAKKYKESFDIHGPKNGRYRDGEEIVDYAVNEPTRADDYDILKNIKWEGKDNAGEEAIATIIDHYNRRNKNKPGFTELTMPTPTAAPASASTPTGAPASGSTTPTSGGGTGAPASGSSTPTSGGGTGAPASGTAGAPPTPAPPSAGQTLLEQKLLEQKLRNNPQPPISTPPGNYLG